MKNNTYTKKLTAYSALTTGLLSLGNSIEAQIIYTDLDPDLFFNATEEPWIDISPLDLNNDGISDFSLILSNQYTSAPAYEDDSRIALIINGYNSNKVAGSLQTNTFAFSTYYGSFITAMCDAHVASALNTGDLISPSLDFEKNNVAWQYSWGGVCDFDGGWDDTGDKYAGLKMIVEGENYYGWVRMNLHIGSFGISELIIKDYAYQSAPNTPIPAGATNSCDTPSPLGVTAITSNSAKIKWLPVEGAAKYLLRYRKAGTSGWINKTIPAPNMSKTIAGLDCNANYIYQIKCICTDGSISAFSNLQSFTTAACRIGDMNSDSALYINIYPNPAQNNLFIDADGFNSDKLKIDVYNIIGESIKTIVIENADQIQLDISDMQNGMYTINISDEQQSISQKFVKQ
ncbi:MAG: T9SS type A sorting domain-containing protein [Fimbriimonadaceae bacterium]|nr:T9SS type A sorting domain-containing protein [Chitinophagales bacterium]